MSSTFPENALGEARTRYYASAGSRDGLILWRDGPPDLAVHSEPAAVWAVGRAHHAGYVTGPKGPVALFRLEVKDAKLDGRYVCDCRRFVRLEEAFG